MERLCGKKPVSTCTVLMDELHFLINHVQRDTKHWSGVRIRPTHAVYTAQSWCEESAVRLATVQRSNWVSWCSDIALELNSADTGFESRHGYQLASSWFTPVSPHEWRKSISVTPWRSLANPQWPLSANRHCPDGILLAASTIRTSTSASPRAVNTMSRL